MSWSDVTGKFLDFLKNPSGLGVFVLLLSFMFLIYVIPVGLLAWLNYDGSTRIVSAIRELKTDLKERAMAIRHRGPGVGLTE
jgi:hypothetical protein